MLRVEDVTECISKYMRFEEHGVSGARFGRNLYEKSRDLGALATGARGFVGGSYNVLSTLVREIMSAFDRGEHDLAAEDAGKLVDAVAAFQRYGGLPAVKAAMRFLGIDCGPV